jgi:hypothetical protein
MCAFHESLAASFSACQRLLRRKLLAMSVLDWILSTALIVTYIFLLFTVCFLTFRKGHILLGILGIFIPFLWLIGAILPAKEGSTYQAQEATRYQGYQTS